MLSMLYRGKILWYIFLHIELFVAFFFILTNIPYFLLQVEKEDVNEAMRLMEMSKDSLTHNNEKTGRLVAGPLDGESWGVLLLSCVEKLI